MVHKLVVPIQPFHAKLSFLVLDPLLNDLAFDVSRDFVLGFLLRIGLHDQFLELSYLFLLGCQCGFVVAVSLFALKCLNRAIFIILGEHLSLNLLLGSSPKNRDLLFVDLIYHHLLSEIILNLSISVKMFL